jgi:flagellar hook-length control protein FliK
VVVDFTDEAPVSGDLIKTAKEFKPVEEITANNLRSLLPQSDEAAVKNKDFLAMLSGDLTSSQRAEARIRSRGELLDGSRSETLSRVNAAGRQVEIPVAENDNSVFMAKENERLQLVQKDAPLLGKDGSAQAADTSRKLWQLGRSLQESEPADPLGMALRQAARPVKQEAGTETAASVQQVKDGYVQAETKVGYVQAEAKAGYVQAAQPHFSAVAASEPAAPKNESWQAVLGDDIKVEAAEPQPLRVPRSQEGQGQMSFGQDRGSNSSASQWVSASMLEADEPAAPVPSQAASQQSAIPAAGFQQLMQDVADVEAVQTPQAAPETQSDYEVPRQIVEQARLIRSGGDTEMVIHLKPEHLGDLTLKISVTESGAVNASFHSDNAQVRTIIENSLVQLKQELSDLREAILARRDLRADEALSKHADWVDELRGRYTFTAENTEAILRDEVGRVFEEVLEDAGVFKRDAQGQAAFLRFVESAKNLLKSFIGDFSRHLLNILYFFLKNQAFGLIHCFVAQCIAIPDGKEFQDFVIFILAESRSF